MPDRLIKVQQPHPPWEDSHRAVPGHPARPPSESPPISSPPSPAPSSSLSGRRGSKYGGGAGMVMSIEPIAALIEKLQAERNYDEIIYMTPDGEILEQTHANQLSLKGNLMILCGHYKGVDERIREMYITKEISIHSTIEKS
jgi:hypothetical protein